MCSLVLNLSLCFRSLLLAYPMSLFTKTRATNAVRQVVTIRTRMLTMMISAGILLSAARLLMAAIFTIVSLTLVMTRNVRTVRTLSMMGNNSTQGPLPTMFYVRPAIA